jgi:hypothetical protein
VTSQLLLLPTPKAPGETTLTRAGFKVTVKPALPGRYRRDPDSQDTTGMWTAEVTAGTVRQELKDRTTTTRRQAITYARALLRDEARERTEHALYTLLRPDAHRWTAKKLAAELGVTTTTIYRWRTGTTVPNDTHLRHLHRLAVDATRPTWMRQAA